MTTMKDGYIAWMRGMGGVRNDTTSPTAPDFDVEAAINQSLTKTLSFNMAPSATSATNTDKRHCWTAPFDMSVQSCYYVPDSAITVANTNYANVNLYSGDGTAAAATLVGTASTAPDTTATNMAAGVPWALTLTAANVDVDSGGTLAVEILKGGTGIAFPQGSLVVEYKER